MYVGALSALFQQALRSGKVQKRHSRGVKHRDIASAPASGSLAEDEAAYLSRYSVLSELAQLQRYFYLSGFCAVDDIIHIYDGVFKYFWVYLLLALHIRANA